MPDKDQSNQQAESPLEGTGLTKTRQRMIASELRGTPALFSEDGAETESGSPTKISVIDQFNQVFGTDDRDPEEAIH